MCNQHPHQEIKHHLYPRSPSASFLPPSPTGLSMLMVWLSVGTENTARALMDFNAEKQMKRGLDELFSRFNREFVID